MINFEQERERTIGMMLRYKQFIRRDMDRMIKVVDDVILDLDRADTVKDFCLILNDGTLKIRGNTNEWFKEFDKILNKQSGG